jgi:ABC-2 type transport system permease protein
MHNLGTVFQFEVGRTIKKKSFWIVSLLFPLGIGAIAGIIYFSNQATEDASKDTAKQQFSFEILDQSGHVSPTIVDSFKAQTATTRDQGISDVTNGKVDAFFYYPADIAKQNIEIYGKDVGLFDNGRYETVAKLLLDQSVAATVSADVSAVLSGKIAATSTMYKDGKPYDGFKEMIAPAVFLVLFYIMIATFGSQMLNSTTEEKENRVIEMILTTIESRTLIIGKIFSLIVLGFLQMIIVIAPVLIGYLLLHDKLDLPSLDLSNLVFNWPRIGIGFLLFATSFIMFTGLLVAIGAAAPTAKEAGSFFGVVMLLIFGPLYAVTLFVSSPNAPIVQFLSYFPFTAPIPLMLRNAVGNLELWQAGISIVILVITASIVMVLAVRAFRYGALEYSRRLTLKEIIGRRS